MEEVDARLAIKNLTIRVIDVSCVFTQKIYDTHVTDQIVTQHKGICLPLMQASTRKAKEELSESGN